MFFARRPSREAIDRFVRDSQELPVSYGPIGIVNGVLCYQTRSVLPGMVMHALFNGAAISATLLLR